MPQKGKTTQASLTPESPRQLPQRRCWSALRQTGRRLCVPARLGSHFTQSGSGHVCGSIGDQLIEQLSLVRWRLHSVVGSNFLPMARYIRRAMYQLTIHSTYSEIWRNRLVTAHTVMYRYIYISGDISAGRPSPNMEPSPAKVVPFLGSGKRGAGGEYNTCRVPR